jgi:hypothetical protein
VPSRGSAVSLVSRFGARNNLMDRSNDPFHLGHTIDCASASVLVQPDVGTQQASGFVKIIELFGSLAPPN